MTGLGLAFLGAFIGSGLILLGWFLLRAAETLRTVRVEGIGEGISELASAWRYDARVRAGIIRAAERKSTPETPEWTRFEEANPLMDPSELQHMLWAYRVLRGEEKVAEDVRADAIRMYSAWKRAGIDLPEIDARSPLPVKENEP
jgi:hypothetical protein